MRWLFGFLLVVLCVAQVVFFARSHLDFVPHYEATQKVLKGELAIYPKGMASSHQLVYSYSPFFPIALAPFLKFLNLAKAKIFWGVFSVACFLLMWFYGERVVEFLSPRYESESLWGARVVTLLILIDPLHTNAVHGNITTVLGALVWGALFYALLDAPKRAGWLAALGISTKLTPGFVLFYGLAFRKWRFLFWSAVGTVFFLGVVPTLFYGFRETVTLYEDWIGMLRYVAGGAFDSPVGNQSPHAIFFRIFQSKSIASAFTMATLVFFIGLLGWGAWRSHRWTALYGCVGIGLTAQGIVWTKQFVWLLPFYFLLNRELCARRLSKGLIAGWLFYITLVYGSTPLFLGRAFSDELTYYGKYYWGLLFLAVLTAVWEAQERHSVTSAPLPLNPKKSRHLPLSTLSPLQN